MGQARVSRWLAGAALLVQAHAALAVQAGEAAPALAAPTADGRVHRLEDLRGHVVYIDFWASWCGPCREALPHLDRMRSDYAARGLAVLAVNVDKDRRDALAMLKRIPLTIPVLYDPQGEWAERFDLPGMPTGYLVGRDGKVLHVQAGYKAKDLPALEARIVEALGTPAVTAPTPSRATPPWRAPAQRSPNAAPSSASPSSGETRQ